jgi:2-hydroxycyclohexanecarboxyl-CoA dehydrogenase
MSRLQGKTALITGGAGSIGIAIARHFISEGARVLLLDRLDAPLAEAVSAMGPQGAPSVRPVICDISCERETVRLSEQIEEFGGRLDVLVNNAAVREHTALADADAASWQRILAVNVVGTALVTRAAIPWLRRSGRGAVVNISSTFGICGRAGMGQYDATKAAMVSATRVLAIEEAKYGVRVNAICPGSVMTSFTAGRAAKRGLSPEEHREHGFLPAPISRWAEPEEIAAPVLWLASDEASFITGAILPVDGGLSAQAVRL